MIRRNSLTSWGSFFLVLWFIVALSATIGMGWSLWWQRDRILYGNLTHAEQRIVVFDRAGLDTRVLPTVERLNNAWPMQQGYTISGDENTASYVKYLLAPRVPDGSPEFYLDLSRLPTSSEPSSLVEVVHPSPMRAFLGWMLSILVVLGCGLFCVGALRQWHNFSVPEAIALGALVVNAFIVSSRFFGYTLDVSGILCISTCLLGVGWFFIAVWQRKNGQILFPLPVIAKCTLIRIGLFVLFALACALALRLATVVVPDDWDAWAIWGAKAKCLALGDGPLSKITYFGQADYPLLWPSVWAFSSWLSGGWEEQFARGWSALFLGLSGWQIVVAGRRCGVPFARALLAGVLFVSIPKVIVVASWSYAESALWLFFICAFTRVASVKKEGSVVDIIIVGIFAVGAAFCKNEGLLFGTLLTGLIAVFSMTKKRFGNVVSYVLTLVVLYSPWLLWVRWSLDLGSHATEGLHIGRLSEIAGRIWPAIYISLNIWCDFQQWGLALMLLAAGMCYFLLYGGYRERMLLSFPLIYLVGLLIVEITHTADIYRQMGASWDRLTIQSLALFVPALLLASGEITRKKYF
jgi:hypothetical protein